MHDDRQLTILLKDWFGVKELRLPGLYLVGGTVRDTLMNCPPKDLDLVCRNAKEFASVIARHKKAALVPMEKKPDEPCYRVVDRMKSDQFLDIAEMRGGTIYEDLLQRDFTINAIALELDEDGAVGRMLDPLNGALDLENKTIRTINDQSFVSDPLRVLRAVRFAAALGFSIEDQTWEGMKRNAALLRGVSAERVMTELMLILKSPGSGPSFRQMDSSGILEVIFPEVAPMKGCPQNGYHHKDVWEHSLLVTENAEHILNDLPHYFGESGSDVADNLKEDRLPLLKLSALLHDAGKPATRGLNPETGRITFYGHEKEGAKIIGDMAARMKLSNRNREFLVLLAAEHLHVLVLASGRTKATTKMRWFRKMRDDAVPAIILSMADVMSSLGPESGEEYRSRHIDWAKKGIHEYYDCIKAKLETPGLINGDDLIGLGMEPGPEIGKVLARVRTGQDTGEISSHEQALELARSLIGQKSL